MKIGKIVVLLIVSGLFFASIATAANEIKIMKDDEDDVMLYTDSLDDVSFTDKKPNIDITQIKYSRTEKVVTIEYSVKGIIENKGDIANYNDLISYTLNILTDEHDYYIMYINRTCQLTIDFSGEQNITNFIIDGSTLTITFNLMNDLETYESMQATTVEMSLVSGMYIDEANDIPLQVEIIEASYEGKVGEDIAFDSDATGGALPYTWSWDFDDGAISTDQYSTEHVYSEAKNYTVTVTITDRNSETATASVPVTVTGETPIPTPSNGILSDKILLFIIIIAIIVIVGIIVLVYILRR
ncbi:MAG: PKD domain-containing protein [Methanobacteriota archaeon]